MKSLRLCLTLLLLFPLLSYAEEASDAKRPINDPDITIFASAAKTAGLGDIFNGTGPFTAFIPTNAAFAKLDQKEWNKLLQPENKDALASFVMYHVMHGKYLTRSLKTREYRTLNGKTLEVTVVGNTIKVNNATVVKADLVGPNGAIHEIDTVLFAP